MLQKVEQIWEEKNILPLFQKLITVILFIRALAAAINVKWILRVCPGYSSG